MDYERYRFVDGLFLNRSGLKDTVREAIASHERLKEIFERAYSKARYDLSSDVIGAIDRVTQAYTAKIFSDESNHYFVALSTDRLDVLENLHGFDLMSYISPILAGYRFACDDYEIDKKPEVLVELISFVSWKTISSGPESINSILQPKLEVFERSAEEKAAKLASTVSEHRRLFDEQKLLHAQAAEATAKAEVQLTDASHAFAHKALDLEDRSFEIDRNIQQLRADLDAQVARFGTEAARKLWGEREKQSRFSLIASSIAIFCLIASPILGAICFTPEVLHYLAQIVAASSLPTTDANGQVLPAPNDTQITIAAIGRLVIVTVPVFLYIWAIRLVVRFNSRSLMLLDDARLRLTMLDTFFHLIEKEGAVKEDRALVLNALFRPGPGHGDNVDPPNFTELVTKAMGSSPGK